MENIKVLKKKFNWSILILNLMLILVLFLSKGTLILSYIRSIPIYIFIISMLYISFYILLDSKWIDLDGKFLSTLNIILSPLLIGLLYYLFKRRNKTTKNKSNIIIKVVFNIMFYINFIIAMFSSLLIVICLIPLKGPSIELLINWVSVISFLGFPILFIFLIISLVFYIVFKVIKYDDFFKLKIFSLLMIINTIPLIFIGIFVLIFTLAFTF